MARGSVVATRLDHLSGVWRLEERRPFSVNSWFVSGRSGAYLIDAGFRGRTDQLVSVVRWLLQGRKLDGILLTHGHRDHRGAALQLAAELGAPIYAHPEEMPYLRGERRYSAVAGARWDYRLAMAFDPLFEPQVPVVWHGPGEGDAVSPSQATVRLPSGSVRTVLLKPLAEGQTVGPFTALHTPGHSPGHLCYLHPVLGAAFVGDLFLKLLPWPTGPFWSFTVNIRENREQQQRVRSIGAAHWALPGHGPPFWLAPLSSRSRGRKEQERTENRSAAE